MDTNSNHHLQSKTSKAAVAGLQFFFVDKNNIVSALLFERSGERNSIIIQTLNVRECAGVLHTCKNAEPNTIIACNIYIRAYFEHTFTAIFTTHSAIDCVCVRVRES